jgi:hypothetical protein
VIKKTKSALKLIHNSQDTADISIHPEVSKPEIFGPGLLSLFESRSCGSISMQNIARLITLINKINPNGSLVQISHDVSVDILNIDGDATITFSYDVANYSFRDLDSRAHRFWFSKPQQNVEIRAFANDHTPLNLEYLDVTSSFIELKINFQKPLESAERFSYYLVFDLKNEFSDTCFYDIGTRTITSNISFSLLAPSRHYFASNKLTLDSSDGFTKENPTFISFSVEEGRQKLTWQIRKPRPGDQFRTSWSLTK